jgi:cystathionine beta-lyase
LLCNPTTRAAPSSPEELLAIDAIAERHNLVICSDEIHCDLLLDKDARHIPYGALSPEAAERSAVMMAPSKTFNIAGLCCSFAVIPMPACGSSCNRRCAASAPTSICWFVAAEAAYEGRAVAE